MESKFVQFVQDYSSHLGQVGDCIDGDQILDKVGSMPQSSNRSSESNAIQSLFLFRFT